MERAVKPGGGRSLLPSWGANLAGFGLLIVLVLAVFFWQLTTIDQDLQRNTLNRSRMMAARSLEKSGWAPRSPTWAKRMRGRRM